MTKKYVYIDKQLETEIERLRKEMETQLQRQVSKVEASRLLGMRLKRNK